MGQGTSLSTVIPRRQAGEKVKPRSAGSLSDGVHGLDGIAGHHPYLYRWMRGNEFGHRFGQELHVQTVHGGDGHGTADDAAQLVDVAAQPGEILQGGACVAQHQLPGIGEPHAVRSPLEQWRAEIVLELQDLPIDGRRRDMKPLRGSANRAVLGDRLEVPQHRRMHRFSASARPCSHDGVSSVVAELRIGALWSDPAHDRIIQEFGIDDNG